MDDKIRCIYHGGEYIAISSDYPSLSWIADTEAEAIEGLRRMIEDDL